MISGGDKRDRTADLLRARQALSQLSYIPMSSFIYYLIHLNHSLSLTMGTTNKDTLSYISLTHFSLFIHFLQYINQSVWTLIVSRFW